MTKETFAKQLLETVNNMNYVGESDEKKVQAIMMLLAPLQPKNRKRFANWGKPEDQSNENECWV